jgi:UDP-N-acetylmuramoyl-tripeptide--D-alanyl-D-alanine ligase
VIPVSLGEVATIVGGEPHDLDLARLVSGSVQFDSRQVRPGDLFLAIPGSVVDGADFAATATQAGAAAVIAERRVGVGCIVVTDPIAAITDLARVNAARLSAVTIGITGSSGKTTTKDLLAQVLATRGATIAPPESFNNELGYPYTVLTAGAGTEFLVLETSARGIGHIRHLAGIAPPRIGVVLNVGSAHLGEFGSVEAIAEAKGELVEALPPADAGGVAVLNHDDSRVRAMSSRTDARVLTFGEHRSAEVRADQVALTVDGRASFRLVHQDEAAQVALRIFGEHQVANALAAAAAALAAGLGVPDIADALSKATSRSRWRMEVCQTDDGITVINDSYNANPESMRSALKSLAVMSAGRRSVAVLGHMAELGADSTREHDALGRLIVRLDISQLLAVGGAARAIANGACLEGSWNGEAQWVPDRATATRVLTEILRPGDVVLIKGSRAAGMDRVADAVLGGHRAGGAAG